MQRILCRNLLSSQLQTHTHTSVCVSACVFCLFTFASVFIEILYVIEVVELIAKLISLNSQLKLCMCQLTVCMQEFLSFFIMKSVFLVFCLSTCRLIRLPLSTGKQNPCCTNRLINQNHLPSRCRVDLLVLLMSCADCASSPEIVEVLITYESTCPIYNLLYIFWRFHI